VPGTAIIERDLHEPASIVGDDEILALLAGFDLVEPGLVWGPLWRPEPGALPGGDPADSNVYAVVARKF
jgi:hypothetical protein